MLAHLRHDLTSARACLSSGRQFGLATLFLAALLAGLVLAQTGQAVSPATAASDQTGRAVSSATTASGQTGAAMAAPEPGVLQPTTVVTIPAAADATIDLYAPDVNYGGEAVLKVSRNYAVTDPHTRSLLRFDLAGVVPPGAVLDYARLELYVTRADGDTPIRIRVTQVISPWAEMFVTWTTAPSFGGPYVDADVGALGSYVTWDVTSLAGAWRTGEDNYGLLLYYAGAGSPSFRRAFGSRENVTYAPRLIVAYHQPAAGQCGGWLTLSADGYVRSNMPDTDFSYCVPDIVVNRETGGDPEVRAYLTVDPAQLAAAIPAGSAVYSAVLEVALSQAPSPQTYTFEVWGVSGTWQEGSLTWNTQPTLTVGFGSRSYTVRYEGADVVNQLRIDVTDLATLWASGAFSSGQMALLAGADNTTVVFQSREYDCGGGKAVGAAPNPPIQPPVAPRLFVQCAAPPNADSDADDVRIKVGMERLRAASSITPTLRVERGAVRTARFKVDIPPGAGSDGRTRAQWFTRAYSDLLSLDDPDMELQVEGRSGDDRSVFFRQRYRGIPVWPAQLVVHLVGNQVTGLSGNYLTDIGVSPEPRLSAEQAEDLALALYARAGHGPGLKSRVQPGAPGSLQAYEFYRPRVRGETQLRYVNMGLVGINPQPEPPGTRLAWLVNLPNGDGYFIDANSGELVYLAPGSRTELETDIYDTNSAAYIDDCWLWESLPDSYDLECSESGCQAGANQDAQAALANLEDVYGWWESYFTVVDPGAARPVFLDQHSRTLVNQNWANAEARPLCAMLKFGHDWEVKDVVGHEYAHAQMGYLPDFGMVYHDEPGAINESMADVFGEFSELYNWPENTYSGAVDWQQGEDLPGGAQRSLSNPPLYNDPDEYDELYTGTDDHGGVHTNNGILNKAAYLIASGGSFNGIDMPLGTGTGWGNVATLYWYALNDLPANADFVTLFHTLEDQAQEFAAELRFSFTHWHVCQVRNAFAAVGIAHVDHDCDGIPDSQDPDNDNDSVPDSEDNCKNVYNPGQANHDSGGYGDACDPDDDNDGVPDDGDGSGVQGDSPCADQQTEGCDDNCRIKWNADQADFNSDGQGDACDDTDGDGVTDAEDNCPNTPNMSQQNSDTGSWGDACDPDDDNDGYPDDGDNSGSQTDNPCLDAGDTNCDDNCRTVPNSQSNADDDAFGGACDLCPYKYNNSYAENVDIDEDGLGNPCDDDDDGDGVLDNGHPGESDPCHGPEDTNCDDNCRTAWNPDQYDYDGDGAGAACDSGDLPEVYTGEETQVQGVNIMTPGGYASYNVNMPYGGKTLGGDTYLPLGYTVSIQVTISTSAAAVTSGGAVEPAAEFVATILDSQGVIWGQATTEPVDGRQVARLEFRPVPYATQRAGGTLAPDEVQYVLELVPSPDAPSQAYDIGLKATGYVVRIYLPLVRRLSP